MTKGLGRPSKLSYRDKHICERKVVRSGMSILQMHSILNLPANVYAVYCTLARETKLIWQQKMKIPPIRKKYKQKHFSFAEKHVPFRSS